MNILIYQTSVNVPSLTAEALSFALTAGGLCAAFLFGAFRFLAMVRKKRTGETQAVNGKLDRAELAAAYAMARAAEEKDRADELLRQKFALEQQLRECDDQRQAYAIRLQMLGQDTDPDTGELLPAED